MCSFQVDLIDYEDIKYYKVCVESCGAKKIIERFVEARKSACDLDSGLPWKISADNGDINDHVSVAAWPSVFCAAFSHLLCNHFSRVCSKTHIPFHHSPSWSLLWRKGRSETKKHSCTYASMCTFNSSRGGFALPRQTFVLRKILLMHCIT